MVEADDAVEAELSAGDVEAVDGEVGEGAPDVGVDGDGAGGDVDGPGCRGGLRRSWGGSRFGHGG